MKYLVIIIISILSITPLINNAQDVITKIDGSEIQAKVIEIGEENIKYKKFSNLDGPIYSMLIKEIFMVKYENGEKELYTIEDSKINEDKSYIRKGSHLGFHVAPGIGKMDPPYIINDQENRELGFGINAGLDYALYFNNTIGIKLGVAYTMIPSIITNIKYYNTDINGNLIYPPHNDGEMSSKLQSIGVPIMVLINTGKELGFYFEGGVIVAFPITSYQTYTLPQWQVQSQSEVEIKTANVVISGQSVAGVNYVLDKKTSLNLGLLAQIPFTTYYSGGSGTDSGFLIGLQFGVLFNLSN